MIKVWGYGNGKSDINILISFEGPSWSLSYGIWIYDYLCHQYLSPLTLWVRIPLRRGVLNATLCDKVCQWFSPGTLVSSTNKTDHHDIAEILLKLAFNSNNPNPISHDSMYVKQQSQRDILQWNLSKLKTCLNQTDFTVTSTN